MRQATKSSRTPDHSENETSHSANERGTTTTGSEPSNNHGRHAEEPIEIGAAGWKDVAFRVKNEIKADHTTLSASGVAFQAFLALVPLLVAVVSIYGLVANPSNVTRLVDRLGSSVPSELAGLIEQQLTSVVQGSSGALGLGAIVGVLIALWSASSGVSYLMEAINVAYGEDVDDRPFWKRRGIAIALTLLIVAFLAAVSTIIGFAVATGGGAGVLLFALAAVSSAALLMGLLATIYRYAPDRDEPEWSWVSVGAAIAVVGWLVASAAFTFYVSRFGTYNETYGSLGAIAIVLLWMFISALAVLVGAEINAELEHQTSRDTTGGEKEAMGDRDAEMADSVGKSSSWSSDTD